MPPLSPRSSSPQSDGIISTAAKLKLSSSKQSPSKAADDGDEEVFTMYASTSTLPNNTLLWKKRRQLKDALIGPSRAIAPVAIIGGTFSVYSSAIQKSSSSNTIHTAQQFTPASIMYLLLLALNYAIMPRLSKRYIHPNTNKQSVALVEEVLKMGLGIGGWVLSGYASTKHVMESSSTTTTSSSATSTLSVLQEQLQYWSPVSTLIAAGLPSALYALQGTLTYTAYQNLDAVTYNGLTQLKVLSSALCCYIILNKRQSPLQMVSLGLLMISSVVFQGSWKDWIRKQDTAITIDKEERKGNDGTRVFLFGVLPCLMATLLSGLAGAFSQRSLQTQVGGEMHRDAYFYTAEISFLSAVCLVVSMSVEHWQRRIRKKKVECTSVKEIDTNSSSFFQHWTYATLLPITTRATAGLLTALVHRHLGSVVKGFALVLGLVFSALLQFVLEGVDLSMGELLGTALVLLSSWLHFRG